jgi:lipoteichoic acid synthase
VRWNRLKPSRWAWPRLFVTPSSYLLVLSLIATMVAKLVVIAGLDGVSVWPLRWLTASSVDVALFLGLAAVLALGEHVSRRLVFITVPIAVVVTVIAIINAGYLAMTGQQITWQILAVGLDRFDDVRGIVGGTPLVSPLRLVLGVMLVAAPPVLAYRGLRRADQARGAAAEGAPRAHAAGLCAVISLLVMLLVPTSTQYALSRLSTSGVVHVYLGLVAPSDTAGGSGMRFAGYLPRDLVEPAAIEALRAGPRSNVVLIILESTRRDETSLPGGSGRAQTPNLTALAARGIDVRSARSVFPHTSKSVWSMLCGRLPLMQTLIYELSATIDVQCLPHILSSAGWRTGFFQSSVGTFEDRPRLVNQLGFDDFLSAEHISKDRLGYLASEDGTLVAPFEAWLDKAPGPFMATLLTSATHHPYALSKPHAERVRAAGRAQSTQRERFDRQIEAADDMIGSVLSAIQKRGLASNTLVVVVGDHGEGFGDKGVKQHDINFYEEGLHVPWVIAGPKVPVRIIEPAASLADLAPTVLDLLGVSLSADALASTFARSILRGQPTNRVLPFGCYYDRSCRGFVVGRTKVVYVPETGEAFRFNLATDPDEREPLTLPDELTTTLAHVLAVIEAHRMSTAPQSHPAIVRYPRWTCPAGRPCQPAP